MNQDIFVLVEHLQGQVADITYVMLAAGADDCPKPRKVK